MDDFYRSPLWRSARAAALARDDHRCTVARLLGGECRGRLHVHHVVPLDHGGAPYDLDNLGSACASHHRKWEALARRLAGARDDVACPECGVRARSGQALELHLANVHGVGAPEADRDLNRRMARDLVDRLHAASFGRAVDGLGDELDVAA